MTVHRFQMDMTREELESVERLGQLASLRTKKEVIGNALTLLKWAAKEILYGRTICSIDEATGKTKQFDLPALANIAEAGSRSPLLTPEQRAERQKELSERAEFPPKGKGVLYVGSPVVESGGPAVVE